MGTFSLRSTSPGRSSPCNCSCYSTKSRKSMLSIAHTVNIFFRTFWNVCFTFNASVKDETGSTKSKNCLLSLPPPHQHPAFAISSFHVLSFFCLIQGYKFQSLTGPLQNCWSPYQFQTMRELSKASSCYRRQGATGVNRVAGILAMLLLPCSKKTASLVEDGLSNINL